MKDWQRSPEPPSIMGIPMKIRRLDSAAVDDEHNCTSSRLFDEVDGSVDPPKSAGAPRSIERDAPPSLTTMCIRIILRNLNAVYDLGDLPFRVAHPILEHCRPDQLLAIEQASPHFKEHTNDIWKRNCLRDFLAIRKEYESGTLKEPKEWAGLYLRTVGKTEAAKAAAGARIKEKYANHKAEKEAKRLVVSERPLIQRKARRTVVSNPTKLREATLCKGQNLLQKARNQGHRQAQLTMRVPRKAPSKTGSPWVGMLTSKRFCGETQRHATQNAFFDPTVKPENHSSVDHAKNTSPKSSSIISDSSSFTPAPIRPVVNFFADNTNRPCYVQSTSSPPVNVALLGRKRQHPTSHKSLPATTNTVTQSNDSCRPFSNTLSSSSAGETMLAIPSSCQSCHSTSPTRTPALTSAAPLSSSKPSTPSVFIPRPKNRTTRPLPTRSSALSGSSSHP